MNSFTESKSNTHNHSPNMSREESGRHNRKALPCGSSEDQE